MSGRTNLAIEIKNGTNAPLEENGLLPGLKGYGRFTCLCQACKKKVFTKDFHFSGTKTLELRCPCGWRGVIGFTAKPTNLEPNPEDVREYPFV